GNIDDLATRSSLLGQLRSLDNEEAWREFLDAYLKPIAGWCRRCRLREDEVDEVVLQIKEKLVSTLPHFVYDRERGRFRDWLRVTVGNEVNEYRRRCRRTPGGQGGGANGKE